MPACVLVCMYVSVCGCMCTCFCYCVLMFVSKYECLCTLAFIFNARVCGQEFMCIEYSYMYTSKYLCMNACIIVCLLKIQKHSSPNQHFSIKHNIFSHFHRL